MFKLHFNKDNGIYSVRRLDRMTVSATEKHAKIPVLGSTIPFCKGNWFLVTPKVFASAKRKERPSVELTVTNWPNVRLFFKCLKEMF